MTAYRSTNTYRQDLLRYDGTVIVNVTVTPAVIAGTSTAPAITVTEGSGVTVTPAVIAATTTAPAVTVAVGTGVTVTPAAIAATATTPAVTVEILLAVRPDTVTGTATLPAVTVTEGAGVTVNAATVSGSGLVPELVVTEGAGTTVELVTVNASSTINVNVIGGVGVTVEASRYNPRTENAVPQVPYRPYFVNDPSFRLARFRTPGARQENVFILTNGTVFRRKPYDISTIQTELLGGHEVPEDLSPADYAALSSSGFSVTPKIVCTTDVPSVTVSR